MIKNYEGGSINLESKGKHRSTQTDVTVAEVIIVHVEDTVTVRAVDKLAPVAERAFTLELLELLSGSKMFDFETSNSLVDLDTAVEVGAPFVSCILVSTEENSTLEVALMGNRKKENRASHQTHTFSTNTCQKALQPFRSIYFRIITEK